MSCSKPKAYERSPIELMSRVIGENGAAITRASITDVSYQVYAFDSEREALAATDGEEIGEETSLTVADVVFDELQTGNGWDCDREGYNFRFTLPGDRRPDGHKWHLVLVRITATGGYEFPLVWIIETLPLPG